MKIRRVESGLQFATVRQWRGTQETYKQDPLELGHCDYSGNKNQVRIAKYLFFSFLHLARLQLRASFLSIQIFIRVNGEQNLRGEVHNFLWKYLLMAE